MCYKKYFSNINNDRQIQVFAKSSSLEVYFAESVRSVHGEIILYLHDLCLIKKVHFVKKQKIEPTLLACIYKSIEKRALMTLYVTAV